MYKENNDIKEFIESYLYNGIVRKLNIKNPDKNSYIDSETGKKMIINGITNLLQIKLNYENNEQIEKILDFNEFLCENIAWNCYGEITKILYDLKKISIYFKIIKILK